MASPKFWSKCLPILLAWGPWLSLGCSDRSRGSAPEKPVSAIWYQVMIAGRSAGFQLTAIMKDGERRLSFQYNDRGRGPKLSSRIKLTDRGIPISVETSGNNELKAAVEERFSVVGRKASWRNRVESGEAAFTGDAFYLSFDPVPEEIALLARALLHIPDGTLHVLPDGVARIRTAEEVRLRVGEQEKTAVLYLIEGLTLSPTPIWLDQEETFFASVFAWGGIIREDWVDTLPELIALQQQAQAKSSADLALSMGRQRRRPLLLRGGTLFDAEAGTMVRGMAVLLNGNRIVQVGPELRIKAAARNAEVLDLAGKTILPGLWDMHAHLFEQDAASYVVFGVTTVRDLANDIDVLSDLRQRIDRRKVVGPRVISAGIIDGPGPLAAPTKVLADTEEQARAAVDRYADLKYEQIKIYSSVRRELVPIIIQQAHRRGLRVSGHVPISMTAEDAVRAGFDELQHMNLLLQNLRSRTRDFTAEAAPEIDLRSESVKALIGLLRDKNIVIDPTLTILERLYTTRTGQMWPAFAQIADELPPLTRRLFLSGGLPVPAGKDEHYLAAFQRMKEMLPMVHDAGIRLVAGTDAVGLAGHVLHHELELYVDAGLTPVTVLQMATIGAARIMKHEAESGSISPGKLADLIIVEGDPTARISDIRRIRTIIKDGVIYDAAKLRHAIGLRPPPNNRPAASGYTH